MLPANWSNPRSHRLRHGRVSIAGSICLVTFTTLGRKRCFANLEAACLVSAVFSEASNWPHARLMAWILMPDHWHGLIELGGSEPLSRCVSRIKAATTRRFNAERMTSGSLWASGFHDRALRREESLVECAGYIVLNPVRAGLVQTCADYPFWDAIWL